MEISMAHLHFSFEAHTTNEIIILLEDDYLLYVGLAKDLNILVSYGTGIK